MLMQGQVIPVDGYFTVLQYIQGLCASDLERRVGFEPGRLSSGYAIVALAPGQLIRPTEIDLKASTRWSSGLVGASRAGREFEQVLGERGQNLTVLKTRVCSYFAATGPKRPAKVIPFLEHRPGMRYPDATSLSTNERGGCPQFLLTVWKPFVVIETKNQ